MTISDIAIIIGAALAVIIVAVFIVRFVFGILLGHIYSSKIPKSSAKAFQTQDEQKH
jgi:hypothetical protein